jgi:hypothetical protein
MLWPTVDMVLLSIIMSSFHDSLINIDQEIRSCSSSSSGGMKGNPTLNLEAKMPLAYVEFVTLLRRNLN